jgi:methylenetetrahydrofolate dehydrogenase (NADP+)/methenyltetrahydrofolate cyclohydrolase
MVISCCGVPNIVTEDMVKENVIIIDIGINFVNEKLVGDVDFNGVKDKCSYITPVPGGIGPMTVVVLMKQTIESAERLNKL